ncbi:cytochrome c biogenesis protein CcdA [Corynebacterium sp. CCM 8862]|uniref:Cytochrome c biogenesis protein CcdA n=1 Tax=Corynebacterium mendelii TaxID=2765362 RepID=A0A939DZK0_9CORY|nr:cytochrome c biogenesis protein CcdA [Corynebacterium mendelii]
MSIGLLGAFLGGVLSILSPCSALLLPAFFAAAFSAKRKLISRTVVFWAGLTVILVPLGMGAGAAGAAITAHRSLMVTVGGTVMIVLGIIALAGKGFAIPGLSTLSGKVRGTGVVQIFLLGCVYGFAGFCAGPVLGAVLTTAAVTASAFYGAVILAMYALGMTVPLFVLAAFWDGLDIGSSHWLRGKPVRLGPLSTTTTQIASGLLFIAIGLLFLSTGGTSWLPNLISLDTQVEMQAAVGNWANGIGDVALVAALSAMVTLALGIHLAIPRSPDWWDQRALFATGTRSRRATPGDTDPAARPAADTPAGATAGAATGGAPAPAPGSMN